MIVSLGVLGDASWEMSHFVTCSVITPHPAEQHLGCQTGHSVTLSSLGVMHQSQSTSLRLSLHLNDLFSQLHPHFKPSSRWAFQNDAKTGNVFARLTADQNTTRSIHRSARSDETASYISGSARVRHFQCQSTQTGRAAAFCCEIGGVLIFPWPIALNSVRADFSNVCV